MGHIPFRDSKLTKLLADSLGGHGLALMIACVSPSSANFQETFKTLRYASKALRIRTRPLLQLDPQQEATLILKREIQELKRENNFLRRQLEIAGLGYGSEGLPTSGIGADNAPRAIPNYEFRHADNVSDAVRAHLEKSKTLRDNVSVRRPSYKEQKGYLGPELVEKRGRKLSVYPGGETRGRQMSRDVSSVRRQSTSTRRPSASGRRRTLSENGPPTPATRRVSTLKRSAAPSGQENESNFSINKLAKTPGSANSKIAEPSVVDPQRRASMLKKAPPTKKTNKINKSLEAFENTPPIKEEPVPAASKKLTKTQKSSDKLDKAPPAKEESAPSTSKKTLKTQKSSDKLDKVPPAKEESAPSTSKKFFKPQKSSDKLDKVPKEESAAPTPKISRSKDRPKNTDELPPINRDKLKNDVDALDKEIDKMKRTTKVKKAA